MNLTIKISLCFLFLISLSSPGFCIFERDLIRDINYAYDNCKKIKYGDVKLKDIDVESECKKNMSDVMQKHFPVGSSVETAVKALDNDGFKVVEYRRDSWRRLPGGVLAPYGTVGFKIGAADSLRGEAKVRAEKSVRLDLVYLFISPLSFIFSDKEIKITFNVDKDGNIIDAICNVGISTI